MAKAALREKAIKLRLQGYTYGQIKQELKISKSTLSDWLRTLPLSSSNLKQLSKNKKLALNLRVEKYRQTTHNKRIERLKRVLSEQQKKLFPLSEKELFIAGLFLFWGEGNKQRGRVIISNTNPLIMQFSKYWMTKILKVPPKKLTVRLHLYTDMDIEENIGYWSRLLNLPRNQFKQSYIKKTNRSGITYKGYGHGTCNLMCFDTNLSERIAMSIKCIAEYCGAKSNLFWYN